jgi:hypothetical protein
MRDFGEIGGALVTMGDDLCLTGNRWPGAVKSYSSAERGASEPPESKTG